MPSLPGKMVALAILTALALALGGAARPAAAQDTGSISGRVIHDLNGDGIAQADEPGLEGWLVVLEDTGVGVRTDSEGGYSFSGLSAGQHRIALVLLPVGIWRTTFPAQSDHIVVSIAVNLPANRQYTGLDFGVRSDVTLLRGTAWLNAQLPSAPVNVQAWVGNRLCSEPLHPTSPEPGPPNYQAGYSIRILSAEARPGCAAEGSLLSLTVNGVKANESVVWYRATEQWLDLTAGDRSALYELDVSCDSCVLSQPITVRAVIDGRLCGESQFEVPMYVWPYPWSERILVPVASALAREGCGIEGAIVNFTIDGLPAYPSAIWLPGLQRVPSVVSPIAVPDTGSGGRSVGDDLVGLTAALAIAGSLLVECAVLVGRRRRMRPRR